MPVFNTEILRNDKEKVLFDLNSDGKKQTKRISSKIIKMDENMAKPLPYGCIKKAYSFRI